MLAAFFLGLRNAPLLLTSLIWLHRRGARDLIVIAIDQDTRRVAIAAASCVDTTDDAMLDRACRGGSRPRRRRLPSRG